VESVDEPTEIVIHVNMLKEGWDVTNLYTIVPLRAANARTLIEQSIGRGLRLPYGKRTGVAAVDRLNIVAHDKFQEIIDEANRGDSPIRLKQVILDAPSADDKKVSVQVEFGRNGRLGFDGCARPWPGASAKLQGAEVPGQPAGVHHGGGKAGRARGHGRDRQVRGQARSGAHQQRAAETRGAEGSWPKWRSA
jgi:type III restriction enzyme